MRKPISALFLTSFQFRPFFGINLYSRNPFNEINFVRNVEENFKDIDDGSIVYGSFSEPRGREHEGG